MMAELGVHMRKVEGRLEVLDELLAICAAVEGEDEQLQGTTQAKEEGLCELGFGEERR